MIIADLSQIATATLMVQTRGVAPVIEADLIHHMILNSIRANNKKFSKEFGQLVIACDDTNNWRKKVFPLYKANRKAGRKESKVDWGAFYNVLDGIIDGLREHFPYPVIRKNGAEADDIIATLCMEYGRPLVGSGTGQILILSGDKDFIQLQRYANVRQYSPVMKKWIRHNNPERYLKEHIMRGDGSDGIPNFLSDVDTCINPDKRQRPLTQKKVDMWVDMKPEEFCNEEQLIRYKQNEQIINLDNVPVDLRKDIMDIYLEELNKSGGSIYQYLKQNKLFNLIESINEF